MIVSRCWQMLTLLWLGAFMRTSEGTFSAQQSYLAQQISERLSLRVSADGFVDTQSCYAALYEADANGDGQISADEYVTVVQMLGPSGFEENATTIGDLPRPLKQAFNLLACLCTIDNPDSQCCVGDNAHISNEGTAPGATPTPEQEVYLFSVCLTTNEAISKTLGTRTPTTSPSASPSTITIAPTFTPTTQPTSPSPTTLPPTTIRPTTASPVTSAPVSNAPTTEPPVTTVPTTKPPVSTVPTTKPPVSTVPTTKPPVTITPTMTPPVTTVPTSQAPVTSVAPTAAPISSMPVTEAPTGGLYPVTVEYEVAYRNGVQTGAPDDLENAMNILAPQVAAETFPDPRRRLMVYARRLSVGVESTQLTGGLPVGSCPPIFSQSDTCQVLQQSITLVISDEDVNTVKAEYKTKLEQAIAEGRLESSLQSVNPNSNVYIVTGVNVAPTVAPTAPADSSGLSSGATAGIAIGAVAGVLLIAFALFALRRRQAEKDDDPYFPGAITASQTLATPQDVEGDIAVEGGTLGAGQADYKIKSKASAAALVEGEIADKSAPQAEGGADSSSNAGSSGWSSSVGNSTLNSGSIDGMDEVPGSSLAAIGAASALAAAGQGKKDSGVPKLPEVTREDLDSAIEAGDWAAVGATAALLAAASDSQSYSSRSRGSTRGGSSISSLDAARAAELDHLVDAGDWEGVVVAAAKFESSEENSTSAASQTSRTAGSSGFSATSTTLSDSPSKAAKRDEIREEVENLVRRVVPEEIDNVDEMMLQFKGREEELVETLRTMQERQVAQKARVQGQKQAKRDARRAAHEGGLALPVPPPAPAAPGGVSAAAAAGIGVGVAAAAGVAAAVGIATRRQDDSDHGSSASGSSSDTSESVFASPVIVPSILGDSSEARSKSERSPSSSEGGADDEITSKKQRTALELAIEAGDWEAVGEAAAMMSDASVNSASTGEINRYAEGDVSTFSGDSTERFQVNALRAAELDDMIDRGDWTGVVAAASRFGGTEVSPIPHDDKSPMSGGETPESLVAAEKERRLKEEQEALAQADLWMEIAKQSKQEGSTDAAASDAADWAIARSLSALKSAESKGELEKQESEGDGSDDSGRSV